MSSGKKKIFAVTGCVVCMAAIAAGLILYYRGTVESVPDTAELETEKIIYPEELAPYVDAIRFFASNDWEDWKQMKETSALFTEDAFVQSLYYLGRIDMSVYDSRQEGIWQISQNIAEAETALDDLLHSLDDPETYDKYEASRQLTDAMDQMEEVKSEADRLREKYPEYFDED